MRLETMALMAGVDIPLAAIREQIGHGIDIIVHQERDPAGQRRIVHVAELEGCVDGAYALREVHV